MQVFTFGHSNHDPETFIARLKQHEITMLVDVRSKPSSRFPHFQRDNLIRLVRGNEIDYRFGGNVLGGMGNVQVDAPLFVTKMDAILEFTQDGHRVAMMCSEGHPCDCHRAGKLTAWFHRHREHVQCTHIMRDGSLIDAREYEPEVKPVVVWPTFGTLDEKGKLRL